MSPDVAALDLRLRRRGAIGYAVGVAVYAVLVVALFPAFKNDRTLDSLTSADPTLGALLGATGSLTAPDGWLNANLYSNFVPLLALSTTIGYGARAIAGQDEDGTLGALVCLPMPRTRVLAEKVVALAVLALPVPVVTLVAALVGRGFGLDLPVTALVATTVLLALMAFDLGLLALAVGAWTGRRGTAIGVAAGVAAAAYLVSSLAPAVHWVHTVRFVSPFFWSVGNDQVKNGADLPGTTLLLLLGVALALVAQRGFRRLDVH